MTKAYHLINDEEYPYIILTSTDKALLEEYMCDMFMEDVMDQFYDYLNYGTIPTFSEVRDAARDAWDSVLDWYLTYCIITDSQFI